MRMFLVKVQFGSVATRTLKKLKFFEPSDVRPIFFHKLFKEECEQRFKFPKRPHRVERLKNNFTPTNYKLAYF